MKKILNGLEGSKEVILAEVISNKYIITELRKYGYDLNTKYAISPWGWGEELLQSVKELKCDNPKCGVHSSITDETYWCQICSLQQEYGVEAKQNKTGEGGCMTTAQIKKLVKTEKENISIANDSQMEAMRALTRIRASCPHKHKESWTNNDGYGQFTVERCLDCGLQRDGGLK